MFGYTIFRLASGEIVPGRSGYCSHYRDVVGQPLGDGEACLDGFHDSQEWYVVGWKAEPRPRLFQGDTAALVADGVDALLIEGVPGGTVVTLRGQASMIEDSILHFSTMVPGRYRLDLAPPFPHQQQTIWVDAHAA
jgi:hypothetical protein